MPKTKIATLNLRIAPGVKDAVREAADIEHRSVANMIEMLIRRHCKAAGITVPEQSDMFPGQSSAQSSIQSPIQSPGQSAGKQNG